MSRFLESRQMADLHVHTVFCDGKNTAEEMVQAAIQCGFSAIGFSGHAPMPFETDWCMTEEGAAAYRAEIRRLREIYADKIRIFLGVEQDYFSQTPVFDYDYVIGSVHYVKKDGEYLPIDESSETLRSVLKIHYNDDFDALAEDYFSLVGDVVRKTGADLIGHFDLLTKFSQRGVLFDAKSSRYRAAWHGAADLLLHTGVPFEINGGAMTRGYRTDPYPSDEILRYLSERGGCAVLSGDCHSAQTLGVGFPEMDAMAKAIGIPLVKTIGNISF